MVCVNGGLYLGSCLIVWEKAVIGWVPSGMRMLIICAPPISGIGWSKRLSRWVRGWCRFIASTTIVLARWQGTFGHQIPEKVVGLTGCGVMVQFTREFLDLSGSNFSGVDGWILVSVFRHISLRRGYRKSQPFASVPEWEG